MAPAGDEQVFYPVVENRVSSLIRRVEILKRNLQNEKRHRMYSRRAEAGLWRVTRWHACPVCDSTKLLRSHRRNAFERMLGCLMLPFRCDRCGARFFRTHHGPRR